MTSQPRGRRLGANCRPAGAAEPVYLTVERRGFEPDVFLALVRPAVDGSKQCVAAATKLRVLVCE
jgi:hypothetical protein